MTSTPRRLALLIALLLPIAACSSSSDGASSDTTAATSTDGGAAGTTADAGSEGSEGTAGSTENPLDIPDDIPLESVVSGIEVAMEPEKVEIEGTVLHVYLAEDNAKVPAGTECIILTSVLPDGATAVVHRGGVDTDC